MSQPPSLSRILIVPGLPVKKEIPLQNAHFHSVSIGLVLDDGRQVRLVGVQAPKLPLGRPGFKPWPLSRQSKALLERLVLNQTVELRLPTTAQDRHGRVRHPDGLGGHGAGMPHLSRRPQGHD